MILTQAYDLEIAWAESGEFDVEPGYVDTVRKRRDAEIDSHRNDLVCTTINCQMRVLDNYIVGDVVTGIRKIDGVKRVTYSVRINADLLKSIRLDLTVYSDMGTSGDLLDRLTEIMGDRGMVVEINWHSA